VHRQHLPVADRRGRGTPLAGHGGPGGAVGVDSAGIQGYHVGEAPDPRSQTAALRRGYDLSRLRARKVQPKDFADFDLLLAMDRDHFHYLRDRARAASTRCGCS
jgi:protein-tyrosine-phosphatase